MSNRAESGPPAGSGAQPAVTAPQPAEEVLRESAEHFRDLAEQSPNMIFINRRGRVIYVNRLCPEIMGYTQEEFLAPQFNFLTLIAPESLETARDSFRRHLQGEEIPSYECALLTKEGKKINTIITTKLIHYAGDQAILGVITDITERKQTEEALRRSESRLRAALRVGKMGYLDWDLLSNKITWSDETYQMYGFNPAEFSPTIESTVMLVHPEDKEYVEQRLKASIRGETAYSIEHRMVRPDGRIIYVHAVAEVTRDVQGTPQRMLGTVIDVTERKQSEQALRESEERFRLFMNNSPTIAWVKDEQGRYVYLSKTFEDRFGARLEDWGGKTDAELWPSQIADKFRENDQTALDCGHAIERIEETVDSDGSRCCWLTSKFPFRDAAGNRFIGGIGLEITELKRAEEAVRTVSARLLNLQEEERRRIARELHDTTGQNLTAMMMHLFTLKAAVPPTNTAAAQALEECCRLSKQCVQEIRTFSYLLHPPVLEELGLARALQDYAAGFQQRSGIKVELDLGTETNSLPKEIETALFRVVQESLGNIHRHSRSPAAAIRLWREKHELWLEIADTGQGIPPQILQEAGAPDSRLGVGIAGMRERMRQLGGQLHIRSGPDGTTVQAVFPANVGTVT